MRSDVRLLLSDGTESVRRDYTDPSERGCGGYTCSGGEYRGSGAVSAAGRREVSAPFGATVPAARTASTAADRGRCQFPWLLAELGARTSKFPKRVRGARGFVGMFCAGAMKGPAGPATPQGHLLPRRTLDGERLGGGPAPGRGGPDGRGRWTRPDGPGLATTRLPASTARPPPFGAPSPGGLHNGDVMRRAGAPCMDGGCDLRRWRRVRGLGSGGAVYTPFGAVISAARTASTAPDRG